VYFGARIFGDERIGRLLNTPAGQLNLAPGADGGQDLACVIGEITRRIFEDGIPAGPRRMFRPALPN
jgi:hypothetical protein